KPEQQTISYNRQAGTNQLLSVTDALGRKTAYTYDSLGNVTTSTQLVGTSEAVATSFTYEPVYDQVTSITDPLNHTTYISYDSNGNAISVTDALGHQTTFGYNTAGQMVSMADALLNTWQFGYELGDLATIIDPDGRPASRFIDGAGRLLSVT